MGRRPLRKPRLRRHADVESSGVGGVKEELGAAARGGAQGRQAMAAMVERSLSGEELGRSAVASKESIEKITSGAEEGEACERERGRSENGCRWSVLSLCVTRRSMTDNGNVFASSVGVGFCELQCPFQPHFEVCGVCWR
jgi:hypothetical protein